MKYAPLTGIIAALLLIICCFIPWAYYPDLQQNFTGFYSKQNNYGKPGWTFIFLTAIAIVLFSLPKLWAKRANQFVAVFIFAYAMKSYFIFSACYLGYCPQIQIGLYAILTLSVIILVSSLLSKGNVKEQA